MSVVDSTSWEDQLRLGLDAVTKYALAICCVVGPLLLGYLAPNQVADSLMPLLADKAVVSFVLPNPDAESVAKIDKLKATLAEKQKTLSEKQGALDRLAAGAADDKQKDARAAVESAQTAEAAAKAEIEKAERSRDADRTIAQSRQISDTLTARYNYAAVSGLLYLVSAATLLLGGAIVFRRSSTLFFVGLGLSLILAWGVTKAPTAYANAGQTFLKVLLDRADENAGVFDPLFAAYKNAVSFKVSDAIRLIIDVNTFVGLLAVGVALLAFAVLSGPEEKPSLASLEERKSNLQRMIMLSSAILVVATLASKVVMDWPLGLIVAPQADALRPLANALTSHLGMTGTIALFAAATPALAGWYQDVKRYRLDTPPAAAGQKQDALDFGVPAAVTSILAILGPALTSPVFVTFKAIVEMLVGGKGGG
ncbi:hypothetical protein ACVIW2_001971 [Bradyrhizobium huanghuaihaiense]|uniref:Uncharacterized protein n=1 Tax=Bradyrhizobium huanghuaihaiense TaxID=990078 RepID=A0A562RRZ3_9BRAD|nr:hypothetical protein [Bradyrhizobium huanghuaihaiense]TWI71852.1 hypothetical protein IQ16_02526 [Bradyrhizobium huanghuaihaiense]